MKIAFDSNLLHSYQNIENAPKKLKADLSVFIEILNNKKKYGLELVFLDKARREVLGESNNVSYLDQFQKILNSVDLTISLSRFPAISPMCLAGQGDIDRQVRYTKFGDYDEKHKQGDAVMVSDAIGAGCEYLLTVDYRLLGKPKFIAYSKEDNLTVITPTDFLNIIQKQ